MKKRLSLFCLALATIFACEPAAQAQSDQPIPGGASYSQQGGFRPMAANLDVGWPGRMWFETNLADRGLGYRGSYLTLGGKTQLFEDFLDGRWLGESQAHFSLESNQFFGNIGLSRVFSVKSAGADFTLGGWLDYDDDRQGSFAHSFTQAAINGSIKTKRWDIIGNGYFPLATTDYAMGDPTGVNCFFENRITLIPGIDSALEGFDVTLRTRPQALSMVNGTLDFGGYGYQSALIDQFGGGRARLGFQLLQGLILNAEVNYDDRFKTTGVLQLAYMFGGSARGNEYSMVGRDLEPTIRNDHIVRFQQDVVFAIDPDTGRPYNVIHVDNNADPAFGNGYVATPYDRLVNAQNASAEQDIIFVHNGDNTTRNYDTGFVMKDGQMLLGDGVAHLIPVQDGRFFQLCNDIDGLRPHITGRNNGAAVTLANDNTVRGFVIDGAVAPGGMAYGIYGNGFVLGSPLDSGIIEDNDISGAILHGIYVNDIVGNWEFNRNNLHNNGFDGLFVENACDPTSVFNLEDNIASNNGRDGIHFSQYDADTMTFLRNRTNGNGRDGVRLEGFKNVSADGIDIQFLGHRASGNIGNGIAVLGGNGDLKFLNNVITNNLGNGLDIQDWTNPTVADYTLIASTAGGVSRYSGNGIGINVEQRVGVQRLLIRETTMDNNLSVGLRALVDTPAGVLDTSLINNLSVSNNLGDGLQFLALGGSIQRVLVDNSTSLLGNLTMNGNQRHGINFQVGDNSGSISRIEAIVQNVDMANTGFAIGNGLNADVFQGGQLNLFSQDVTIVNSAGDGVALNIDNDGIGAVNEIVLTNYSVFDNGGNGLNLTTGTDTLTDVFVTNSQFSNIANVQTPTTGTPIPQGGLNGILINTTGDGAGAAIDNRTRLIMRGNLISNFNGNGVSGLSVGDSSLLVEFTGNQISGNGSAFNVDQFPFFHGVQLTSAGTSTLSARFTNNLITDNFERGMVLTTLGTSSMNVALDSNSISDNDRGEDIPNDPIVDTDFSDAAFTNNAGAQLCMALTNNVFQFAPTWVNTGAAVDFTIELDGGTNGFGAAAIGPGFTYGAFGALCNPAITAEETAFSLDGFNNR